MAAMALRPRRMKPSRSRPARRLISYREQSSDSDESEGIGSEDDYVAKPSQPRMRDPPAPTAALGPNFPRKRKPSGHGGHRRPSGGAKKAKTNPCVSKMQEHKDTAMQLTGKAMPWQTLPYHILATILDYASRPLLSDTFEPLPSINWLCHVARCCKAFTEPALSTLYYSPPLSPPTRAYNLLEQLATQSDRSTFNYGAKIKYLDAEASGLLLHKYAGHDPIDLGAFVAFTPQLRGIGIHLLSDNPKLRNGLNLSRGTSGKGIYQPSMFAALEEHKVTLQVWTWNQLLGKQSIPLVELKNIHKTKPFHSLRNIAFVNYEGRPHMKDKAKRREDIFIEALSMLPNLDGLSFRMCSIISDRLVPLLPENLGRLEIIDCASLKSPALHNFLSTKGRTIRALILDHNNSLNLSFLADLAQDCPNLKHLKMDLRYFNTFFTVRDLDPKYDVLFEETETPSWPSSLQTLELYHLRKWSLTTAEIFFSSLTGASRYLPNLRQLRIKASLEASGWRDRVKFRDKFTQRLKHVFLRKSTPPNPHLKSIGAFRVFKEQQSGGRTNGLEQNRPVTARSAVMDKGSVLFSHVEIPAPVVRDQDSDSDAPLITMRRSPPEQDGSDELPSKLRRSTRPKSQREDIYNMSEDSPNSCKPARRRRRKKGPADSSSEDSAIDDEDIEPKLRNNIADEEQDLHVQGLCDFVDVMIDNLRPTEEQLNEDDFLDEEASGDEDWNGNDDVPGDERYAW